MKTARTLIGISLVSCAIVAVSCGAHTEQTAPPQPAQPPPRPAAEPEKEKVQQVAHRWGTGWTVKIRPVFSGQEVASGDGDVTVDSWENGPSKVRYDFPAFTTSSPKPEVIAASDGLIRRAPSKGTISVDGSASHDAVFIPPALWPGGDAKASGSLIWLPPEVTAALKSRNEATMKVSALPNGLTMRTTAAETSGVVTLTVTGRGEVVIPINGTKTRFPAVRLRDDLGSLYTVLDSSQNPLVVRFRFGSKPIVDGKKLVTGAGSGYDVVALSGPGRDRSPFE